MLTDRGAAMKGTLWLGIALLAVAIAPCRAQQSAASNSTPAKSPDKPSAEVKPATTDPGYIIGADDIIIINVWKEPELSRTVPVRPDGKISLPLLDDVQASGYTPVQLGLFLTEKLKKFIAEPQVTVMVSTINSRKIHLVGEVGRTGTITMLPDMTALQAVASSSPTQFANLKKIYILRWENGVQKKIPFNYKEVIKGNQPDIALKPGDTIVVP
jgi:polysaccharide export outer membrane protein